MIDNILELFEEVKKLNLKNYEIAILYYENNKLILEKMIDRITKFQQYELMARQFNFYKNITTNPFKNKEYDGLAITTNGEITFMKKQEDNTFVYANVWLGSE